jgi:hypothetical protein
MGLKKVVAEKVDEVVAQAEELNAKVDGIVDEAVSDAVSVVNKSKFSWLRLAGVAALVLIIVGLLAVY